MPEPLRKAALTDYGLVAISRYRVLPGRELVIERGDFVLPDALAIYADGLRKAGLPEE